MNSSKTSFTCALLLWTFSLSSSPGLEPLKNTRPDLLSAELRQGVGMVFVDDGKRLYSATAFCSHSSGIYVTGYPGLAGLKTGAQVKIHLDPGGAAQRVVDSEILKHDRNLGITILKATRSGEKHFPLPFPTPGEETLTGEWYPLCYQEVEKADKIGADSLELLTAPLIPPANIKISPNVDKTIYMEHMAGAPVLDHLGHVVGVLAQPQRSRQFKPCAKILGLVNGVVVKIPRPKVRAADMLVDRTTLYLALEFPENQQPVKIDRIAGWLGTDKVAGFESLGDHRYKIFVDRPPGVSSLVRVEAEYPDGSVKKGSVLNQKVSVRGKPVWLSALKSIRRSAQNPKQATLTNKAGKALKVEDFHINTSWYVDIRQRTGFRDIRDALKITIGEHFLEPVRGEHTGIPLKLDLWSKDAFVAAARTEIQFDVAGWTPPKEAGSLAKNAKLQHTTWPEVEFPAASKTVNFPEIMSDCFTAGGGRYMIAQLDDLGKCAVYDLVTDEQLGYIDVGTKALVCAGMKSVISYQPDTEMITRHSLPDLKVRKRVKWKFDAKPLAIAMGSGSTGRALAAIVVNNSKSSRSNRSSTMINLVEIKEEALTLRQIQLDARGETIGQRPESIVAGAMRAARDGRSFTICTNTARAISIHADGLNFKTSWRMTAGTHNHQMVDAHPAADSSAIYTNIGVYDQKIFRELHSGGISVSTARFLPTEDPKYFLSFPWQGHHIRLLKDEERPVAAPSPPTGFVHDAKTFRPIAIIPRLPVEANINRFGKGVRTDFPADRRIFCIPQANRLVIVRSDCKGFIIVPFDLKEVAGKLDIPYIILRQEGSPWLVSAGEKSRYQYKIDSSDSGIRLDVLASSEGMTLSEKGILEYAVPDTAGRTWSASTHFRLVDSKGNVLDCKIDLRTPNEWPQHSEEEPAPAPRR